MDPSAAPPAELPLVPRSAWPAIVALLLAIGLVIAAAWNAQASLAEMNAVTDARAKARTGRFSLEHVLSLFKDVETGARGFVITGQESYLAPYQHGLQSLPTAYRQLQASLDASYPSGFDWSAMDTLVRQRLDLAEQVIAERRQKERVSTEEYPLLEHGKQVMDQIRDNFAKLDAHQQQRVDQLNEQVRELRRRAVFFSVLSTGATVMLVSVAAYLLLRERQLRRRLEGLLRRSNSSLEGVVAERTAELSEAHRRLAGFAGEQERHIEAERRRLSREVHDQIGQVLTAIRLIFRSLPPSSLPADQEAALEKALDLGIASTRRIAAELRPPLLDDLGLAAALQHFAEQFGQRSELACTVTVADQTVLGEAQKLSLFRIVQEACTNILRHAAASRIDITGRLDGTHYLLAICDDGRGFDPGKIRPGALGLLGMRERAALIGGECKISTSPGAGTCIEIRLQPNQEANA
ncbi:CHASE3 domain-containing protein [Dechloromonas sp. XY25]|uniref:CHASE3 domain-containing protein n=1 Tax=Dechloromonas hankyongensis TaxID=2908002 RepID=A0ABS9K0J3_9RHOO|nr:CHASE3 domain-containing protein [Dechloromonas hankyongensis]MCG2576636.1 CHASE3 domain-containing protein [Dechloromonas hankyongensis]